MHPTQKLLKALANPMRRGIGSKGPNIAGAARRNLNPTKVHGEAERPVKAEGLPDMYNSIFTAVQTSFVAPVSRALRAFLDYRNHEDIVSKLRKLNRSQNQVSNLAWIDLDTAFKEPNETTIWRTFGIEARGPKDYKLISAVTKVPTLDAELDNPDNKKEHDERLCAGGNHSGPNYQVEETHHSSIDDICACLEDRFRVLPQDVLSRAKRGANWRNKVNPSLELQLNNSLIKADVSQKCHVHMINGRYAGKGFPAGRTYEYMRQQSMYTAKANQWEKKAFANGLIGRMTSEVERRVQVALSLLPDFFGAKIGDIRHLTKLDGVENKERKMRPFPRPKIESENKPPVN